MGKNACKDCEHFDHRLTYYNSNSASKCKVGKTEFIAIEGYILKEYCMTKNRNGDCPDFSQKEIDNGKTKTEHRQGNKTDSESKAKEKTWRNGWGILHKQGV